MSAAPAAAPPVPAGAVPEDANEHCPGTGAPGAGAAPACAGCPNAAACASAPPRPPPGELDPDQAAVAARLAGVKHVVLVLSGKGGVGKSTLAAQLALALAAAGREVGLLDVDICGPSAPKMLGLEGQEVRQSGSGWSPVFAAENLAVMSIGFMLPRADDAVVWRGPRKNALIAQFLRDVDWGPLDYLVVDAPPGTSDEHISLAQLLKGSAAQHSNLAGAVIVATPQEVALIDVRKEVNFCRKTGIPILGVVENMAGLRAPLRALRVLAADGRDVTATVMQAAEAAGGGGPLFAETEVFVASGGGAAAMAAAMDVPFLGRVPLDAAVSAAGEAGRSVFDGAPGGGPAAAAPALRAVLDALVAAAEAPRSAGAAGADGAAAQ